MQWSDRCAMTNWYTGSWHSNPYHVLPPALRACQAPPELAIATRPGFLQRQEQDTHQCTLSVGWMSTTQGRGN
jgi:hypothetical protein